MTAFFNQVKDIVLRVLLRKPDSAHSTDLISSLQAAGSAVVEREDSRVLLRVIKAAILAVFFVTPLLYLPFTADPLFAKVAVVEIAAVIVGAAWLLNILVSRRIRYRAGPFNIAFLILAIVLILATIFSTSPWASAWGPDPTGERLASVLAFFIIAFATAAVFERKDVLRALGALFASLLVLGTFALASIFAGRFLGAVPAWLNINPIGTVNALGYVLGLGFIASMALVMARMSRGEEAFPVWLGRLAAAASIVLFIPLVFIGFSTLWAGIAVVLAVVLAFNFIRLMRGSGGRDEEGAEPGGAERRGPAFSPVSASIGFAVLIVSVFLTFRPLALTSSIFQPPVEVSPSLSATLAIGGQVFKSKPIFAMGPANFITAYNRFRDPTLNSTIFWTARFSHGFSFFSTLLSTVGIIGTLMFLVLALVVLWVVLRNLIAAGEDDPVLPALGAGLVFIVVMWFLYASNFTASFIFFSFLGLFGASAGGAARAADAVPASRIAGWFRVRERAISVGAPALNFLVSLAVVFAAALSLVFLYGAGAQYAAEVYFNRAVQVMNLYGNVDTAKVFLDRATRLNPVSDVYFQARAQVSLVATQRLIAQATAQPSEDLSVKFRQELSEAVSAAQRATSFAPANPVNWLVLGQIYETVMPFIPGADRATLEAYAQALDDDPSNPALLFARGRVFVTLADIAAFQIDRASGEEQARFESARAEALGEARSAFEGALALKGDYADANFLLAQVAIREGNLQDAIRKTEATATFAPNDVGVAFQLGFLYFRADDLDNAKAAFDRAVLLNDNYSNARYFLGLIYDRTGDRDAALSQFQKIAVLNPDNDEVKKIIANLTAGKPALFGIVPPAPAPENRTGPPVSEGKTPTPIQRP